MTKNGYAKDIKVPHVTRPGYPLASVRLVLIYATIILSFLPYLTFGPIAAPSQVQPWAALLAWAYCLYRLLFRGITINRAQTTIIIFSIWFMVYVYTAAEFDYMTYFRRSASFLLSSGIMIAATYATPTQVWRCLTLVLPAWLGFALLRYVDSGLYFSFVRLLVPTVVELSTRGSSSLAPEATDFGFMMAFLLVIAMITRFVIRENGSQASRWPLIVAIAAMMLSTSGTGIFSLALIGLIFIVEGGSGKRVRRLMGYLSLIVVSTAGYLLILSLPETGVRGIDLLTQVVSSPADLVNTTFSYRLVHNAVGILGMIDSSFIGYGAGGFLAEGPRIYRDYNLGGVFGLTGWYAQNVPTTLSQSPLAFFPVILLEYGLVGLIFIFVVFYSASRTKAPFRLLSVVMLFIAWAQSFPAAWPPFWLLLGLLMNPRFRSKASHAGRKAIGKQSIMQADASHS